jgi:hypothetical protein
MCSFSSSSAVAQHKLHVELSDARYLMKNVFYIGLLADEQAKSSVPDVHELSRYNKYQRFTLIF